MHKIVNVLSWAVLIAALGYQTQLSWQVGDLLFGGNNYLRITFTLLVASLLLMTDYLVKSGVVKLTAWNWHMTGVAAVTTLVMAGVLTLEVARIDIAQNAGPLASSLAKDHEAALQEPLTALELKFQEQDALASYNHLTALVGALKTADAVERRGGDRPDIEEALRKEGIEFDFSGHKGKSRSLTVLNSITRQKEAELAKLQVLFDKRFGTNPPTLKSDLVEDRAKVQAVVSRVNQMKGFVLSPATYTEFLARSASNSDTVNQLLSKYQVPVKLNMPPVKSLFIVGLEGALEPSVSAVTLWLIAIGTAFGGVLLLLFVQAVMPVEKKHPVLEMTKPLAA